MTKVMTQMTDELEVPCGPKFEAAQPSYTWCSSLHKLLVLGKRANCVHLTSNLALWDRPSPRVSRFSMNIIPGPETGHLRRPMGPSVP